MSEHTPGPWKSRDALGGVWGPNGMIADVVSSEEFCDADARLIAAAPDLLRACEAALRYVEELKTREKLLMDKFGGWAPCEEEDSFLHEMAKLSRAAIAKARGEE